MRKASKEMTKILRAVLIVGIVAIIASGCSALLRKSETEVTVDPSRIHEDCTDLFPGDVMVYSFRASSPVDFNIHFHEEGTITYPVSEKNISNDEGKFSPERKQFYCLMWTNPQKEPVHLTYSYHIVKK
jgi:hypothetical protein